MAGLRRHFSGESATASTPGSTGYRPPSGTRSTTPGTRRGLPRQEIVEIFGVAHGEPSGAGERSLALAVVAPGGESAADAEGRHPFEVTELVVDKGDRGKGYRGTRPDRRQVAGLADPGLLVEHQLGSEGEDAVHESTRTKARVAGSMERGTIVALLPDGGWKYLSARNAPLRPFSMASVLWLHGPAMLEKMKQTNRPWPRFSKPEMVDLTAYLNSPEFLSSK